jgi:hypothetical protein
MDQDDRSGVTVRRIYYRLEEFVRPAKIRNTITGEWMVCDDIEIHRDDIDWLMDLLHSRWSLDWDLHIAEWEARGKASPFTMEGWAS